MDFNEWTARWQVPAQAVAELRSLSLPDTRDKAGVSEGAVQSEIRIVAAQVECNLMRNNSGATQPPRLEDMDKVFRPVRYGLGNDSARINKVRKSSDLIGLTRVNITAQHVGRTLGVFTAAEIKKPGWNFAKKLTAEEQAQSNFLTWVKANGGIATFATNPRHLLEAIEELK
ncbi:MAG: hypothetical protein JKY94_17705 [Rhodobacteraceae bacterium]|nr:hypothetical protein [Paracoccaceae bacterium]